MSLPIKFSRRQLRALGILARRGQVIKVSDAVYRVKSQSTDRTYRVVWSAGTWTCNCPDYSKTLRTCKHGWTIAIMLESVAGLNNITQPDWNSCSQSTRQTHSMR